MPPEAKDTEAVTVRRVPLDLFGMAFGIAGLAGTASAPGGPPLRPP
ncbi:hypothetical protein [Actinoallomurus sp. NPDC052274]